MISPKQTNTKFLSFQNRQTPLKIDIYSDGVGIEQKQGWARETTKQVNTSLHLSKAKWLCWAALSCHSVLAIAEIYPEPSMSVEEVVVSLSPAVDVFLGWEGSIEGNLPEGYLVQCDTDGNFTNSEQPVDGYNAVFDIDCISGGGWCSKCSSK